MVWEGAKTKTFRFAFLNISFCRAKTFRFADYTCAQEGDDGTENNVDNDDVNKFIHKLDI